MAFLFTLAYYLIPIATLLYFYVQRKFSYWAKLGVQGPTPSLLSFGNVFQIQGQTNPPVDELNLIRKHGSVFGTYNLFEPVLNVADIELSKTVMIKDFHLFVNRRVLPAFHEIGSVNLFFVDGADWKQMRSLTSPTFSTAKLRAMKVHVDRALDKLTTFLDTSIENGAAVLNGKDVMMGFTLDVIMSAFFATETNANGGDRQANPVLKSMLDIGNIPTLQGLSYLTMPAWFNNLVKCQHLLNYQHFDYITGVMREILRQRKSQKAAKGGKTDLVQLLLDAQMSESELRKVTYAHLEADDAKETQLEIGKNDSSKGMKKLTDNEIISNCQLFFGAGNDTTATTLANLVFELIQNPAIGERLHREVSEALEGLDPQSEAYYEKVMFDIPYLDAAIKETLRKYSPLKRVERRVGVDGYKLGKVPLKKDQLVEVMVYAIHYNPDFYPDPHSFSPDRFLPENKHLLVPNAYLPFGIGPRNCIGMRFAYQSLKLCLAKILLRYRFEATQDTPRDRLAKPFRFTVELTGFPVKFSKR